MRPRLQLTRAGVDGLRTSVEEVAIGQVELCRALRAVAGELRFRLGIYPADAADEVLEQILKRAGGLAAEELASPLGVTKPPRAPSPNLADLTHEDRVAAPLGTSAKAQMHAEASAFQKLSERQEALQREVSGLRRVVEDSTASAQQVAEEEATVAMEKVEAKLCLQQLRQLEEFKGTLEQALDQREHLASLARDAVEHRLHEYLATLQETMEKQLEELRGQMSQIEKVEQEAMCLGYRIDGALEEVSKVDEASRQRSEESMHLVNWTLADFRVGELRQQADSCRDLQRCTSGIARGVLKLAQVCGVLAESEDLDLEPLDAERSGSGIRPRIDDAWEVIGQGCESLPDLMLKKADDLLAARLQSEIGDFDARVYRECLHLIASHQGLQEGEKEPRMPSRSYVHFRKPASRHSPNRGTSAQSTTCPTELPPEMRGTPVSFVQGGRPSTARSGSSRLSFYRRMTS